MVNSARHVRRRAEHLPLFCVGVCVITVYLFPGNADYRLCIFSRTERERKSCLFDPLPGAPFTGSENYFCDKIFLSGHNNPWRVFRFEMTEFLNSELRD